MTTESSHSGVDATDTESQASFVSCSGTKRSTDVNCDCAGCKDFTVPNQPVDVSESKKTHRHQSKEKKSDDPKIYSRKIQPHWYAKFPWITVCSSTFRIYCVLCRRAKHEKLLLSNQTSAFVDGGFCN